MRLSIPSVRAPFAAAACLSTACAFGGPADYETRGVELERVEVEARDDVRVLVGLDGEGEPVSEAWLMVADDRGMLRIDFEGEALTIVTSPLVGGVGVAYDRDIWTFEWTSDSDEDLPSEAFARWNTVAGAWREALLDGDRLAPGVRASINLATESPPAEASLPEWREVCATVVGWQCHFGTPSVALGCEIAGHAYCGALAQ